MRISITRIPKGLSRFATEEKGMTLPLLALTFMVVMGFVGLAVDIARHQLVQSRLSFAVDAAGLAAGSTISSTNVSTELMKYLQANFPVGYLGTKTPVISYNVNSNKTIIDVSATVEMPTTFMAIFGYDDMNVGATTQITRKSTGLELVMVLDNTGSMGNPATKIAALKTAATTLVNTLFGTSSSTDNLWIGLVPFAQVVNIGTSHTDWVDQTHLATLNWGKTTWMGCVDARDANGRDIVDDPPTVEKYKAYYAPSTDNLTNYPFLPSTKYLTVNKWVKTRYADGTPKTYDIDFTDNVPSPNYNCPKEITPMTANKSTLLTAISNMKAIGNTEINIGAIWGWNMISPRWRGLWGGEMDTAGLPLDYGTDKMIKAVVILTDGENAISAQYYASYGFLSEGRLGSTTNESIAETTLNTKLLSVCSAMKSKGIYIYTIAFGTGISTSTANLLKSCATGASYYFYSPSTSELQTVFGQIADSLSNLRVSM